MALLTRDLAPLQERILAQNFDRLGPFFIGRDLHAMLDCACAPELSLTSHPASPAAQLDLSRPLTIPFAAKFREEFFGGILFDRKAHAHYML
ncbi:MAG: hypothetical protein ACRDSH_19900, partial [Pseudonocardiaceae bacterium]